ncbi:tRNA pseudouridine(38-40) synthase TruA [Brevibacterium sp. BRM-1]|uniref:tRNA pseudouridine(38-40) synthase TruA n=1 Tax=Brevibacterium sp. BRM-1 TaxID=2999062 RepID=UPI002281E927|nr:tRNA pseudouridine(38-40) synthase TruA [Brevibacterium sp. BRM-1]WAL40153.1 tRNA pseudouridine(38-40) synthase TruA [Brevibacterium sp. BRM-1]
MTRFRVDLGYRGTAFHGWARQPGLRTVQGEVEDALALVTGAPVATVVAGRTDAGVHARHQVLHLDLEAPALARLAGRGDREPGAALAARLRGALGRGGARDIAIHSAAQAPPDFDARFAAVWRAYRYRLADAATFRDPLRADSTAEHRGRLDEAAMARAAGELLGLHDFLPFCKPRPEATTVRTLFALEVARDADDALEVRLRADAFCHHMVRALVGGLVRVGSGAWPASRPAELLARAEAGEGKAALGPMSVLPAHGLVLEAIGYPDPQEFAAQARTTRARRPDIGSHQH